MHIRPLQDRLLLSRLSTEEKTPGGIVIPDAHKEKGERARVIAVGSGKLNPDGTVRPMSVKVGDTVLLSKWPGGEVKLNGEDYLVVSEEDVLAVESD